MNTLLEMVLNGQTVKEALAAEAKAIKALGQDRREKTYDAKIDHGYVTAKIYPIPKEDLKRR